MMLHPGADLRQQLFEQLNSRAVFDQAVLFSEKLAAQGFRILNQVVFGQILVAGGSATETTQTLAFIQASGECWCGGALWQGPPVISISLSSWVTTLADMDRSVDVFVASREKARQTVQPPGRG